MPKGLKVGLSILAIGISIPVITMFLTLRNKPVYHTIQPKVEGCFVQFTWQEKPVTNLEHILIFLEKPEVYEAGSGLDMFPNEKSKGYVVFPRGVFYDNSNILKSKQKVYRMAKRDVRTWILIQGKAFSAELDSKYLDELKAITEKINHKEPSADSIGKMLSSSEAWKELMSQLTEIKKKKAEGKLDLSPDRKRSDFMR